MIYVYAITDGHADLLDLVGLDDQSLRARRVGGVCAAYSEHDARRRFDPSPELLWWHEAVVDSLVRRRDAVLPMRFGVTLPDAAALDVALARHAPQFAAGLDRVAGCVEMGLRVRKLRGDNRGASPAIPSSGRAYMQAKLEEERGRRDTESRAAQLGDALDAALAPLARDHTRRLAPRAGALLTAAYLVPREAIEAFVGRTRALAAEHGDVHIACTGPWPPYHFTPALPHVGATEAAHA